MNRENTNPNVNRPNGKRKKTTMRRRWQWLIKWRRKQRKGKCTPCEIVHAAGEKYVTSKHQKLYTFFFNPRYCFLRIWNCSCEYEVYRCKYLNTKYLDWADTFGVTYNFYQTIMFIGNFINFRIFLGELLRILVLLCIYIFRIWLVVH